MKKLSDFKGEDAIEIFAEIVEPISLIVADPEVQKLRDETKGKDKKVPVGRYVSIALKNHKREVIQILATLNEMPIDEFESKLNGANLPILLVSLINDPEIMSLFTSQGQTRESSLPHSGSAMESTEVDAN